MLNGISLTESTRPQNVRYKAFPQQHQLLWCATPLSHLVMLTYRSKLLYCEKLGKKNYNFQAYYLIS